MPETWDLILRLALATVVAGIIGAERELSDKPAGFRTHALVGLGAALFSVISAFGYQAIVGLGPAGPVRADVTRIASQIVVGIGFLGGGAILKSGVSVRGLTTAATLWTTAAIGTAIGLGAYTLGLVAAGLGLVALEGLRPVRRILRRHSQASGKLQVQMEGPGELAALLSDLERAGVRMREIQLDESEGTSVDILVRLPSTMTGVDLTERLADRQGVAAVDWTDL